MIPLPHLLHDTRANYEQLESEFLVQVQDVVGVATADTDEETVRHLVTNLVDAEAAPPQTN